MAAIKAYTDLSQSKTLSKILPLESADMSFNVEKQYQVILHPYMTSNWIAVPCWSLTALLNVLPFPSLYKDKLGNNKVGWMVSVYPDNTRYDSYWHDNPIDACVEMIVKLHEQNLL